MSAVGSNIRSDDNIHTRAMRADGDLLGSHTGNVATHRALPSP